jgi:hypothetical protein
MPQHPEEADGSIIEQYHQNALEAGAAIRSKLSDAVRDGILRMANALLQEPDNAELRRRLAEGEIRPLDFYNELLRLVYRLLFLLVIEERDLVFPKGDGDDADSAATGKLSPREVYRRFYAVNRLRELAERPHFADGRRRDLWTSLFHTFELFESAEVGGRLGVAPLAGELFGAQAVENIAGTKLNNETLLYVLGQLLRFRNDQGEWVRVNYAALNVEEFGSVYEGLLEFTPTVQEGPSPEHGRGWTFRYGKGDERAATGSHYTPDELVRPLIEHALDPVIERKLEEAGESPKARERAILDMKVCDPACGSGHFLLAAARRLAERLAQTRTGEEQPNPAAVRTATREVIGRCIYGVDKNPMAVELCKVALWLEAHDPGKPLTFLDHRIKCGDAIVGLARADDLKEGIPDEAFKTLDGDDKEVAKTLRDRNKKERKQRETKTLQLQLGDEVTDDLQAVAQRFRWFQALPDTTLEEREAKEAAYAELSGPEWVRLKALADAAVAPFFQRKTLEDKERVLTDGPFRRLLHERGPLMGRQDVAAAMGTATEKRLFHWFLEFPEVFDGGGFDCILGNPPYLGGTLISGAHGKDYFNYLKQAFAPAGNRCDLIGYFFRRIFDLVRESGALGCIATNTLAQGDTREGGLSVILNEDGVINFAVRSITWPGDATLEVTLVTIQRRVSVSTFHLDGKTVSTINSYLSDEEPLPEPYTLRGDEKLSFEGVKAYGQGFVIEPEEAADLITANPHNADILFPYINGSDLNSSPSQAPSRWIINFFDWPLSKAQAYPECYHIVESKVKPERQRWKKDKNGSDIVGKYQLRKPLPQRWWQYAEKRPALFESLAKADRVLVTPRVTKTGGFVFQPTDIVFSEALVIFALETYAAFALLQSSLHHYWAWKNASTLESRLRYTASSVFDTYPFPRASAEQEAVLERVGEVYYILRQDFMLRLQVGLTETYNLFHDSDLGVEGLQKAASVDLDEAAAEKAVADLQRLRDLHREMDEAVRDAYGWDDLDLGHGFHEVDFLPENDRVRYTISPKARKQVLRRLLLLNHERHAEEEAEETDKNAEAMPRARREITEQASVKTPAPLRQPVLPEKTEEKRSPVKRAAADTESDRKAGDREANPQFKRAALAAELVERLRGTRGFGRMKLQKAIYLCEKHAALKIKSDYLKEKHGPFDPGMMGNVEKILLQNKWAERVKRATGKGYDYVPLEKAGGHREYFDRYWGHAEPDIESVVNHLASLSGRESEIVATLYGVWLELLEKGGEPTLRALVSGAFAWHPAKRKISAHDWEWWAEWMRQKGLQPANPDTQGS